MKKDVPSNSQTKVSTPTQDSGVHAHPLHKRSNDPPQVASLGSASSSQQTPSNVQQKQQTQAARTPVVSRPLTQAVPARTRRDTPKVAAVPTTTNVNNQKPLYNQQRKPSNAQAQQLPLTNTNSQKAQPAPSSPAVAAKPATQPIGQPILSQASRVRRDAPRVTDVKASSQNVSVSNTDSKTQQAAKVHSPVQASRVTRDAPKPVDPKAAPASTTPLKSQAPSVVSGQSSVTSNVPAHVAKTPSANSRQARDAPNPQEQSKIVPSAYQPAKSADASLNPTVDAKKPLTASQTPLHKRESPSRDSSSSTSSNNNQSPTFVHPVPVSQILKKADNTPPAVTV